MEPFAVKGNQGLCIRQRDKRQLAEMPSATGQVNWQKPDAVRERHAFSQNSTTTAQINIQPKRAIHLQQW
jgi:hypothetical protein